MKRSFILFVLLLVLDHCMGQTPVNGGFEDGLTGWTSTGSVGATNARTGTKALVSASSTSASNTAHLNSTVISIAAASYAHVIGWAIGSNSFSNASCGGTLNATTNSTATSNIGTTLTRLVYNVQNNSGSTASFSCRVNSRSSTAGNATQVYWDDVILYTDATTAPDLVKPLPASVFTNGAILPNTVAFSWTNGSDAVTGIQASIVLRTTNTTAAIPVMNDQGVYTVTGGTAGPNMVDADWMVLTVSVSPGVTSYTDNTVTESTAYKYAIIHRDLAYNYSIALVSGIITTPAASPVPVLLLRFSGYKEGNHNQLRWSTATENNNRGFEIQRSVDGINYTVIGFVNSLAAAGNSNDQLDYTYTDNDPAGNKQYYRLRQLDLDNRDKLSKILLIKGEKLALPGIEGLFPNPAKSTVNLVIVNGEKEKLTIKITDINGRTVLQQEVEVETGCNTIPVDIIRLDRGTYLVQLFHSNGYASAARLIKQ
ncbi:MAG: T9SS type A sorting domain-containing protein [Chitinophagaceae bacterium]